MIQVFSVSFSASYVSCMTISRRSRGPIMSDYSVSLSEYDRDLLERILYVLAEVRDEIKSFKPSTPPIEPLDNEVKRKD